MKTISSFITKTALIAVFIISSFISIAQIKVACIGDSITEGSGLETSQTYPTQLQLLMKSPFEVKNYGRAGSSVLKDARVSYWKQSVYQQALQYNPDIVIIKLGTNDSKEEYWVYKSKFYNDYVDLVNSFKNLNSHPQIFICYPIPAFPNRFGIREEVIKKEIIPFVKQVAKETNSTFIDLYTPFHGKQSLLSDGVHPNPDGALFLAKEVFKAIRR